MVTMATGMAMARKTSYFLLGFFSSLPLLGHAGEGTITPGVALVETYTNNIDLTPANHNASLVSQAKFLLNGEYESQGFQFDIKSENIYAVYSHDHRLDKGYQNLQANARVLLWPNGVNFIASADISNQARNSIDNSLADLITGDVVQVGTYQGGFAYQIQNLSFNLDTSVVYEIRRTEDNIGEQEGYNAYLRSESSSSARLIFWQINSQYSDRKNDVNTGRNYVSEVLVGWVNPWHVNPFLRFYNEGFSGSISRPPQSSGDSIGVGISWKLASHFILGTSYNFTSDELSEDYIAAAIDWQPSERTSLSATYGKRFFGNAYNLDFKHRTRRLTNTITYNETLQVFDRNNYRQVLVGNFFCPASFSTSGDISSCFQANDSVVNVNDFQVIQVFNQELIQSNEFSLNKDLSWQSELALTRTTFTLNIRNSDRKNLSSGQKDRRLNADFNITRQVSPNSDFAVNFAFIHNQLDREQLLTVGQEDFYRIYSATYTRNLARTLNANISLQHVNRNSSDLLRTYDENRVTLNLTKDF